MLLIVYLWDITLPTFQASVESADSAIIFDGQVKEPAEKTANEAKTKVIISRAYDEVDFTNQGANTLIIRILTPDWYTGSSTLR